MEKEETRNIRTLDYTTPDGREETARFVVTCTDGVYLWEMLPDSQNEESRAYEMPKLSY